MYHFGLSVEHEIAKMCIAKVNKRERWVGGRPHPFTADGNLNLAVYVKEQKIKNLNTHIHTHL